MVKTGNDGDSKSYSLCIMNSSAVATLFLETDTGSMDYVHENKENSDSGVYVLFPDKVCEPIAGEIKNIHGRGNASWRDYDKKSYQMELNYTTDFWGMGEAETWLLIANADDNTLLKNYVAFDIADKLGLAYTPEAEFADVYANGEYLGNYLLCEKVEVGTDRIGIQDLEEMTELLNPNCELKEFPAFSEEYGKLINIKGHQILNEPEDISGGYLLELEIENRYDAEPSAFITANHQRVVIKSPQYASYPQVTYIAQRYQEFEDAVYAEDGVNPYTGMHYDEYIDTDSWVRKYLIEEVTKNLDSAFTSQFFYKPADSESTRIFAGPVWDYDKSIGFSDLKEPEGMYACRAIKGTEIWGEIYPHENIWHMLYQHEDFYKEVIEIYNSELKLIVDKVVKEKIPVEASRLSDSAIMDATRWNNFGGLGTFEGKRNAYGEKVAEMSDFLMLRLEFLNNEWEKERDK